MSRYGYSCEKGCLSARCPFYRSNSRILRFANSSFAVRRLFFYYIFFSFYSGLLVFFHSSSSLLGESFSLLGSLLLNSRIIFCRISFSRCSLTSLSIRYLITFSVYSLLLNRDDYIDCSAISILTLRFLFYSITELLDICSD